jgi:cell division protein FtsB
MNFRAAARQPAAAIAHALVPRAQLVAALLQGLSFADRSRAGHARRRLAGAVLLALLVVWIGYFFAFGPNGWFDHQRKRAEFAELAAAHRQLEQENRDLQKRIVELQTNRHAIEAAARDMGMVRPGDIVVHPDAPPVSATPSAMFPAARRAAVAPPEMNSSAPSAAAPRPPRPLLVTGACLLFAVVFFYALRRRLARRRPPQQDSRLFSGPGDPMR